jgi:hypothetical protein
LALALAYGRTRTAPDLTVPIRKIFPAATTVVERGDVFHVYGEEDRLIGWAAAGSASGYGGPLLLVAGVDTMGHVIGARIVEQRESPVFWSMVLPGVYFEGIAGSGYDEVDYDYESIAGVTGATISSAAVVEGVRVSIAEIAGAAFDVRLPLPRRPFEFGSLEIAVLGLLAVGIAAQRIGGLTRRRLRWATQIAGLIIIGFWQGSPITLAKLAAIGSGYFPDPRVSSALYVLIAGFLITSIVWGRNIYCLYVCPFGAAQRCVGVIGGTRFTLPVWSIRLMERLRNVIVFAALCMAFLTLQPALASYEPFAALFSLRGSNLQWLLLFIVLVVSLAVRNPWCGFWCPMRTIETALRDIRNLFRKQAESTGNE